MNLISSTTLLVAVAYASVDAATLSHPRADSFAAANSDAADKSDAGWGGAVNQSPRGSASEVTANMGVGHIPPNTGVLATKVMSQLTGDTNVLMGRGPATHIGLGDGSTMVATTFVMANIPLGN